MKKLLFVLLMFPVLCFGQVWEESGKESVYSTTEQCFVVRMNTEFQNSVYLEIIEDGPRFLPYRKFVFFGFRHVPTFTKMTVMNYDNLGRKVWRGSVMVSTLTDSKGIINCKELHDHLQGSGYSTISYLTGKNREQVTIIIPGKLNKKD